MSDKLVSEGRWVVGTDGSLRAEKAVMWAAKHASERVTPVPLLILHAIPESPIPSREAAAVAQSEGRSYEEMVHDKAERIVGDIAARVRSEYPNLPVETAVVEGHPADLLAEAGKDADQIVVATSTRPDHAEAGRLLLNALADRDEHSARLADQAVVLVSQADREEADASSIARGFDALARAVVTVPYDPAMRQQWLRVDNLAAPTQRAYLRAAAAVAAGL